MESDKNKILIDLNDGLQLVAEKSFDPVFPREIAIYVSKHGKVLQDLVVVGQNYRINRDTYSPDYSNQFSIKIYGSECSEDFTEEYLIPLYYE